MFSFGPALVADGEITVSQKDEVGKAMVSNPRTAIGVVAPLHYLFVVSDGRTSQSAGLSLYELAQLMQLLGAQTAYNLDAADRPPCISMVRSSTTPPPTAGASRKGA